MAKIEEEIEQWSIKLSARLSEIKIWDVSEIKAILNSYLTMAMKDCLNTQTSETKNKINQTKILIANCEGRNQQKYQSQLIKLKADLHQESKLLNDVSAIIRKKDKYSIMCKLIFDKFGKDVLEELKENVKKQIEIQ